MLVSPLQELLVLREHGVDHLIEHVLGRLGVSAASNQEGPTAGSGINQVLEITEIVDALHLSGDDLERLQVRFVPATEAVARANFSIGRISVFKL